MPGLGGSVQFIRKHRHSPVNVKLSPDLMGSPHPLGVSFCFEKKIYVKKRNELAFHPGPVEAPSGEGSPLRQPEPVHFLFYPLEQGIQSINSIISSTSSSALTHDRTSFLELWRKLSYDQITHLKCKILVTYANHTHMTYEFL